MSSGRPPRDAAAKARLGFLPESPYFYDHLTAREFLGLAARLSAVPKSEATGRVTGLLRLLRMESAADVQMRGFSRGMLQRMGIAQALVADPELVVLDEPMGGLDPIGRKEFRDIIVDLRDRGKTVFFSTHILSDVEMICDRVGIVIEGRMVGGRPPERDTDRRRRVDRGHGQGRDRQDAEDPGTRIPALDQVR